MAKYSKMAKQQSGVGLIEVLVAALVLAIGLVGLAGLQLYSVQSTHSSYYRSVATLIAVDIEERLWLHVASVGSLPNDLDGFEADVTGFWNDACPETLEDCSLLPDLQVDIEEGTLGSGNVFQDYDVEIVWSESRFGGAPKESFDYRLRVPTGLVNL